VIDEESLRCRVCGLAQASPPWGEDGQTPLFEHCPCCGVEWGYQDATPLGARRFRESWIRKGARWDRPDLRPRDWNLQQQIACVPATFVSKSQGTMNETRTACPRCGQDWLMNVRLVHLSRQAILCPECEALWVDREPRADNFEDYGTFMQRNGRENPDRPEEIETIGLFRKTAP
jgi:hypothetical protein